MNVWIKLAVGAVLLALLTWLTVAQVPHSERLVDLLFTALVGLGITHISGTAPASKEDE